MKWKTPPIRLSESAAIKIARELPDTNHWDWDRHAHARVSEENGRYIWTVNAGIAVDAMLFLTIDDATGQPLQAWVPGPGRPGRFAAYWFDSSIAGAWTEFESDVRKQMKGRRDLRQDAATVLAAARRAVAESGLAWREPVCMRFDYGGDRWSLITNASANRDNLWIDVRDADASIARLAAYREEE